jgi:hypothetical protein
LIAIHTRSQYIISILTIVSTLVYLISPQLAAASGTTISIEHSVDTADRTIIYDNQAYEFHENGFYPVGEAVNVTITTTEVKSYQISLIDKEQNFLWNQIVYFTEGKEEVTMPAGIVTTPDTYAFAVFYQGDILAIEPVVFSNYTLSMTLNTTTVAPGGTLNVDVTAFPDTSLPIKVVLTQGSRCLEFPVNRTSKGHYETDITIPESAHGSFSSYAAIASGKMKMGYPELIAIAKGGVIEVTDLTDLPRESGDSSSSMWIIASFFFAVLFIHLLKRIRR